MRRWSEVAARIAATSRTSEKVATLAEYLRSLAADELPLAVRFMTGRPFATSDSRTTGIGWAAIAATAQDLVTGITKLSESGLVVSYTLSATPAAGVVAEQGKRVPIRHSRAAGIQ